MCCLGNLSSFSYAVHYLSIRRRSVGLCLHNYLDWHAFKQFFFIMQEHTLSSRAKNPATAKKLWEESEKFVDLQPNDPHI